MKRPIPPIAAPVLSALVLAAGPAAAHHPMGGTTPATLMEGLLSGLGHPVIGPDHLAFLLGLALVAGLAGWGAVRALVFVAGSLAGVVTAWAGLALPGAEALVALSVIGIGAALLARAELPAGAWAALLAAAGLAHGQAFAEAVIGAEATPVLAYLLGLAAVQAAIVLGVAKLAAERPALGRLPRLAGIAAMVVGAAALLA
ncbi:HupE/UreJ family protein [Falsiroseomonas ponticola]|uniref:HupE/UreJ family protein n=1 Tax=Falsiroseomonas ponticola TaxID=2786951 RepID=UPI0019326F30|nr:HupE/UreJ family protein [Roseomonas ponticola]